MFFTSVSLRMCQFPGWLFFYPSQIVVTVASLSSVQLKAKATWRERVLRTQKYGHLSYRCGLCCKTYKGLNVMRHAISHLKNRKLKCILCGKRFKQFPLAKKHVLDHIDEMCKQKPPDEEPSTDTTPTANGIIDDTKEGKTPSAKVEASEQKSKSKTKLESLTREERIIRNVRILLKKTSGIQKKDSTSRQVDFKDEQVVLSDDLVVIKEPFFRKDKEGGEEQERPAGENGCNVDVKFHLCPSDSCDKVFMRLGSTITKHALRCHVEEEKVLEKAFLWSKRKCSFCLRWETCDMKFYEVWFSIISNQKNLYFYSTFVLQADSVLSALQRPCEAARGFFALFLLPFGVHQTLRTAAGVKGPRQDPSALHPSVSVHRLWEALLQLSGSLWPWMEALCPRSTERRVGANHPGSEAAQLWGSVEAESEGWRVVAAKQEGRGSHSGCSCGQG